MKDPLVYIPLKNGGNKMDKFTSDKENAVNGQDQIFKLNISSM
jgi:hypothetical protein